MKAKKLLASILAVSMLVSLLFATVASAETDVTATLTIKNDKAVTNISISGKSFDTYQVFSAEIVAGSKDGADYDGIEYYVADAYENFFKDTETLKAAVEKLGEDVQNTFNASFTEDDWTTLAAGQVAPAAVDDPSVFDIAAAALVTACNDAGVLQTLTTLLRTYTLNTENGVSIAATTGSTVHTSGTEESVSTAALDAGYYLVLDSDTTAPDGGVIAAGALVTLPGRSSGLLNANVTVSVKTGVPDIVKEIWHNDLTNDGVDNLPGNGVYPETIGSWDTVGDYQIGDTVYYRLTVTVPDSVAGYTSYIFNITDTITDGVSYNKDLMISTDPALQSEVPGQLHTDTTDATNPNELFSLDFDMLAIKAAYPTLEEFYIYYTGVVTEDAQIASGYDTNTVVLTYSNDPYDSSSTESVDSSVYNFTFALDVFKTEGDATSALADATFALYSVASDDHATETKIYLERVEDSGLAVPTYYVSTGNTDGDYGTITTDANGKFQIIGLDDETTYLLRETAAPVGYNKADDVTFTIHALYAKDDGTGAVRIPTVTASGIDNSLSITIVNTSSAILPSTGGVGTTIFTILGCAMMLGAGAILLAKRKRESEIDE